jgi:hypothetical protein
VAAHTHVHMGPSPCPNHLRRSHARLGPSSSLPLNPFTHSGDIPEIPCLLSRPDAVALAMDEILAAADVPAAPSERPGCTGEAHVGTSAGRPRLTGAAAESAQQRAAHVALGEKVGCSCPSPPPALPPSRRCRLAAVVLPPSFRRCRSAAVVPPPPSFHRHRPAAIAPAPSSR